MRIGTKKLCKKANINGPKNRFNFSFSKIFIVSFFSFWAELPPRPDFDSFREIYPKYPFFALFFYICIPLSTVKWQAMHVCINSVAVKQDEDNSDK